MRNTSSAENFLLKEHYLILGNSVVNTNFSESTLLTAAPEDWEHINHQADHK